MVADDRNILLGVSPQGSAPELLLLTKASGGVGSSRPRSQGVEEVFFPHQPAGDKGSVDGPARLLGPSSRSLSGVDDQQHHSCVLNQQSRGTVSSSLYLLTRHVLL